MDNDALIARLQERFGEDTVSVDPLSRDRAVRVPEDRLMEVMGFLREDPEFRMDFLDSITALDLLGLTGVSGEGPAPFRCVYHLFSYAHRHGLVLFADVNRDEPVLPSMCGLWESAVWLEREAYDLIGIVYEGHPNLCRLLLPTEFEGHPLRRDWTEPAHQMGISTTRETPIELLKFFHETMGGALPGGGGALPGAGEAK